MVKSMTGYGRAVETVNGREFTVELRSVNNRYLDCTVKLRGPEAEIAAMNEENIRAVVDFTNAEVGTATYKVTIVCGEQFPNVGAVKPSSVSATVQALGG